MEVFDDKNLQVGDEIQFLNGETKELFAKAKLTEVVEKTFRELNESDKTGHEEIGDEKEILQIYSRYYNTKVTLDTPLKIITFQIL